MSINKGILIEIERETANTRQLLSKISDEHLDWRPHEKSMSLSSLVAHIVELHNWLRKALEQDTFDLAKDYVPFKPSTIEQALAKLQRNYEANISFVEGMNEADWQKLWTLRYGDHIIAEIPKIGAQRFIIFNHLIHHRGQLTVYMRMLNIAVPGIYGPSADDQ